MDHNRTIQYPIAKAQPIHLATSEDIRQRMLSRQKRRRVMTDTERQSPVRHRLIRNPADVVSEEIMKQESSSSSSECSSSLSSLANVLQFLEITEDMIVSYKMHIIDALRTETVDALRKLHDAGENLQCCNRFGESLIHMACRRGLTEVVRFLVKEAKVSLLVKDDYGRTPLHDAFWTVQPRFDLVQFIVEECPELLCVRDVRGHVPLNYARKEDWAAWCDFFDAEKRILLRRKPPMTIG